MPGSGCNFIWAAKQETACAWATYTKQGTCLKMEAVTFYSSIPHEYLQ